MPPLRSGCQCRLPKELGAPKHRFIAPFQRWVGTGVLHRMWGALVEGCEELDGVDWEWQAADGAMPRHVLGGPDWAQPYGPWQGWYQAQSPCGWRGRPLEHCGCGSKRARCQAVGGDPGRHCGRTTAQPTEEEPQHLCLDKGYDNPSGRLPPDTALGAHPTHRRGEAGRLWRQAVSGRAGRLWNGRWHGSPSAVRSWSGTTRKQRTTSVCYSSIAEPVVPATVTSGHFEYSLLST